MQNTWDPYTLYEHATKMIPEILWQKFLVLFTFLRKELIFIYDHVRLSFICIFTGTDNVLIWSHFLTFSKYIIALILWQWFFCQVLTNALLFCRIANKVTFASLMYTEPRIHDAREIVMMSKSFFHIYIGPSSRTGKLSTKLCANIYLKSWY